MRAASVNLMLLEIFFLILLPHRRQFLHSQRRDEGRGEFGVDGDAAAAPLATRKRRQRIHLVGHEV